MSRGHPDYRCNGDCGERSCSFLFLRLVQLIVRFITLPGITADLIASQSRSLFFVTPACPVRHVVAIFTFECYGGAERVCLGRSCSRNRVSGTSYCYRFCTEDWHADRPNVPSGWRATSCPYPEKTVDSLNNCRNFRADADPRRWAVLHIPRVGWVVRIGNTDSKNGARSPRKLRQSQNLGY